MESVVDGPCMWVLGVPAGRNLGLISTATNKNGSYYGVPNVKYVTVRSDKLP